MKNQNNIRLSLFTASLALAGALALSTAQAEDHDHHHAKADLSKLPPAAAKTGVTYATDIKPIFETSCVKCHGEERPKAGLKLTSLESTLKGNKDGKVVVAGDIAKSPLLISVACISDDEDSWMPPKNNKAKIAPLTKDQIGLIRAWIEQGAK